MKIAFLKYKYLLFFILGLLNALPFTFDFLFFLSWFSIAPFFVMLVYCSDENISGKALFKCIFLYFWAYHLGIYYFFFSLVPMTYVGLGIFSSFILMFLAWFLFSAFHALAFAFAMWLAFKLRLGVINKIIAAVLVFVLVEFILSLGNFGFTWARISLPQSYLLPLIQSSSLLGGYFVDLILLFVNAFIAFAALNYRRTVFTACALSLFFVNFLYGFVYMQMDFQPIFERKVTLVQGNVLPDKKWNDDSSYSVYLKESLLLDETNSLVIWGETAVPSRINTSKTIMSQLQSYTLMSGNDLLLGAFFESDVGNLYNAAYYISQGETYGEVYFKRKVVPFGEFLPFRALLENVPALDDINLSSDDITAGKSANVFHTAYGNVGALVCFDSIFPSLARTSVLEGAQVLAIITNDSWYKDDPAVYQHNNQAVWRAVENGRFVARSANSGISSFITPHGEIIASTSPLEKSTITETMEFIDTKTLYTKLGDIIIIPIAVIFLFYVALTIKKLPHQRKCVDISSDKSDN